MKERLFGPQWESKDASVRVRAIVENDDPKLLPSLPGIARDDPDATVRLAALKRLSDENAWLKARLNDSDDKIRTNADPFLLRAACQRPAGELQAQRMAWLEALDDADSIRRLATSAVDGDVRAAALRRVQSPGFLGDCYIAEPDDAIAAGILERIDQISTLRRIATSLRKSHKKRRQAVMQRLAALEGDRGQHSARDELADHLIHQVEQLARGTFSGDRKAEADRIEAEWRSLPKPDEASARRFDGALKIVRSALKPKPVAVPPSGGTSESGPKDQPPVESGPDEAGPQADAELEQLTDRARRVASQPASEKTHATINELLSQFDRRWNSIGRPTPADTATRTHFMALAGELQARQQLLENAASPAPVAETRRPDEPDAPDSADSAGLEALKKALEHAEKALESADIGKSHQAITKARERLRKLPPKRQPAAVTGQLTRMAGKLKELRDWQHWSNNKLRERLIERVGEIDAASLHPDAVTARLKELRERWKELDHQETLPGDKRRFSASQGHWRRFQKACNEVFDAARPYLEKRSEVRDQALAELKQFLEQAGRIVEQPETASDLLIRYQRAAREAIRNLDSLPPKSRGKMASALRQLMDAISARLDQHFEAIENEKRRLIAEARKLEHEKERAVAIDRAKALQAEWKKVGHSRRKTDDKLWREFREPIDPLFEELKEQRQRQTESERQHNQALKDLCEQAEKLANSPTEELEAARGPLAGLEQQFNQQTPIPQALRQRLDRALAQHRSRMNDLAAERDQQKQAHIQELAEALQTTWQMRLDGGETRQQRGRDLPDIPAGDLLGQRLRERLGQFMADDADLDALAGQVREATAGARRTVIEMECLAGVETPEEDRRQRMDYQISRLSDRLGEGAPRPDLVTERAERYQRWLGSFPHDPAQHAALAKRFETADRILKKMAAVE
ncbi:MAG: DUF349 domain-containing protein [Wenzhouxiangellaceae bacterium]